MAQKQDPWHLWNPYRRQSATVLAFRWWGEPVHGFDRVAVDRDADGFIRHQLVVRTFDGELRADVGDWVVRDDAGDDTSYKDATFRAIHEIREPTGART